MSGGGGDTSRIFSPTINTLCSDENNIHNSTTTGEGHNNCNNMTCDASYPSRLTAWLFNILMVNSKHVRTVYNIVVHEIVIHRDDIILNDKTLTC